MEKQQIYFAHPEQLNDPMEGMRLYYWQGDEIVWRNLLKHYLLCLEHMILLARLTDEDEQLKKEDIPVFKSFDSLPTESYKKRIQEIYDVFFSNNFVENYLQFIIVNPNKIYEEEMFVHLKLLSNYALDAILEIDIKHGLVPDSSEKGRKRRDTEDFSKGFTGVWDELKTDLNGEENYKILMQVISEYMREMDHQHLYQLKDSVKMRNIFIEFPQLYLDAIKKLTYPEAYIACFMDSCNNSSIWGSYGDNHRGVCLKYKVADEQNPVLNLKSIIGYSSSGKTYGYRKYPLQKISYSTDFEELDFFRNIGRIPINPLLNQWYMNEAGELSECAGHIKEDMEEEMEEWRKNHWESFEKAFLKKLPEWSSEREYRIILSSVLDSFTNPQDRLLEYEFEDLEAIIFGLRTPIDEKNKIIELVSRKCQELGVQEFNFYEMAYSTTKQEMYQRKVLTVNN
ncbi:hypothetical protein AB1K89_05930 [Sporosarcina sp. 179-K 8C2 HS]|uniref:hypothetical protein n=1 Tax=Sporosarcina sp. 179-K 8C2 HS TaxID=3142387 RepID=UPI0039A2E309